MKCILCAPFMWLLGKVCGSPCPNIWEDFWQRASDWDNEQIDDWAIWEADPKKDAFLEARGLLKSDPKRGFDALLVLAEQGSVLGMAEVGRCFFEGIGVPSDPERGEHWFGRACDGGSQYALLHLAEHYARLRDFDKCYQVALRGHERAFVPAVYLLGWVVLARSKTRAGRLQARPSIEWAAEQGSLAAQWRLSNASIRGRFGAREIPRGVILTYRLGRRLLDLESAVTKDGASSPAAPTA